MRSDPRNFVGKASTSKTNVKRVMLSIFCLMMKLCTNIVSGFKDTTIKEKSLNTWSAGFPCIVEGSSADPSSECLPPSVLNLGQNHRYNIVIHCILWLIDQ